MTNSWKRPKLKIPKTKSEWIWDMIGFSFYFASIILLIFVWSKLPDKVPAHYNALGEVDRWGSKGLLLIFPILGAFIFAMMQALEKFPETHNYPKRLNENNAEQFYLSSRKVINKLKNICLIIFALVLFEFISTPLGWGSGFERWFFPLVLVGIGIPLIAGILGQRKIK